MSRTHGPDGASTCLSTVVVHAKKSGNATGPRVTEALHRF